MAHCATPCNFYIHNVLILQHNPQHIVVLLYEKSYSHTCARVHRGTVHKNQQTFLWNQAIFWTFSTMSHWVDSFLKTSRKQTCMFSVDDILWFQLPKLTVEGQLKYNHFFGLSALQLGSIELYQVPKSLHMPTEIFPLKQQIQESFLCENNEVSVFSLPKHAFGEATGTKCCYTSVYQGPRRKNDTPSFREKQLAEHFSG